MSAANDEFVTLYVVSDRMGERDCLTVIDRRDINASSQELVNERLVKCHADNGALLKQTKDFIYAMADFLNNQGDKTDTSLLECYKNTLQQTMRGGAL